MSITGTLKKFLLGFFRYAMAKRASGTVKKKAKPQRKRGPTKKRASQTKSERIAKKNFVSKVPKKSVSLLIVTPSTESGNIFFGMVAVQNDSVDCFET